MPISQMAVVAGHGVFAAWLCAFVASPGPGETRIPQLEPLAAHVMPAHADSSNAGHFSLVQAQRGEDLYDEFCAECHGFDLSGEDAKPLAGDAFMESWGRGKHTVDDLFYIIRTQMPYGDAGTLDRQQYIDVIAYILSKNGYSAGETDLIPDPDTLRTIVIGPQPGP